MGIAGDYVKALEVLLRGLQYAEQRRSIDIDVNYSTIGSIYSRMGNYSEAVRYNIEALKTEETLGRVIEPGVYSNLADAYIKSNHLDSALRYQKLALELAFRLGSLRWQTISYCNLGDLYSKQKNFVDANFYFHTALNSSYLTGVENEDRLTLWFEIYYGLGKNKWDSGDKDSAYLYGVKAYYYAKRYPGYQKVLQSAKFLNSYYKDHNLTDSVVKFQDLIIAFQDSAFDHEATKKTEDLRIAEQYRQIERIAEERKEKKERVRNIQLALIGFFIPLFAGVVYLMGIRTRKNSKRKGRIIVSLGVVSLLMLFEFISLLIHPSIERITGHDAVWMFLTLLVIASILVPAHHKLEEFLRSKL